MDIILQKLKAGDYPHFLRWWRDDELMGLTSGDHAPMGDEEIQKQVAKMASDKNVRHWLIEVDDKIVGHINLNKINSKTAELQIVIGEKEYWGKGIGFEAIIKVLDQAKSFGYKKILVEVRPDNIRAINLYQKAGFEKQGLKKYPKNPNLPEVLVMEKQISNSY